MPCTNYTFKRAKAGTSLSMTQTIDGDAATDVVFVVNTFHIKFFSFDVEHKIDCETCHPTPEKSASERPNVFSVLMNAARDAVGSDVPRVIAVPTCKKDRLKMKFLPSSLRRTVYTPQTVAVVPVHFFHSCVSCTILMATILKFRLKLPEQRNCPQPSPRGSAVSMHRKSTNIEKEH